MSKNYSILKIFIKSYQTEHTLKNSTARQYSLYAGCIIPGLYADCQSSLLNCLWLTPAHQNLISDTIIVLKF